jgi:hypothetical protein
MENPDLEELAVEKDASGGGEQKNVTPEQVQEDDLSEFIRQRLENEAKWDDLVLEVGERGNMNWAEAEEFIHQVESQHGGRIHSQRRWWLLLLGAELAAGGGVLAGYGILALTAMFSALHQQTGDLKITVDAFFLSGEYFPMPALLSVIGTVMMIGGVISLVRSRPPGRGKNGEKK